jgi:hypothetical protein
VPVNNKIVKLSFDNFLVDVVRILGGNNLKIAFKTNTENNDDKYEY